MDIKKILLNRFNVSELGLSWYQLDRYMRSNSLHSYTSDLINLINDMEGEGLIELISFDQPQPSFYKITALGKRYLNQEEKYDVVD